MKVTTNPRLAYGKRYTIPEFTEGELRIFNSISFPNDPEHRTVVLTIRAVYDTDDGRQREHYLKISDEFEINQLEGAIKRWRQQYAEKPTGKD